MTLVATGTVTYTPITNGTTVTNDEYWIDQVTIIPDPFQDLIPLYAASMMAPSLGLDGAAIYQRYLQELQLIGRRWTLPIGAEVQEQPSLKREELR